MKFAYQTGLMAAIGSLVISTGLLAAPQERPVQAGAHPLGEVVKVDQAGPAKASPGDLIQIQVTYPVVPGGFLDNLEVEINGKAVRLATVASTRVTTANSGQIYGAGALSAFLVADGEGKAVVKIRPIKQRGGRGDELVYQLTIAKRNQP